MIAHEARLLAMATAFLTRLPVARRLPEMQHVVVTGRNAPKELIEVADTVTEMALVIHTFLNGVKRTLESSGNSATKISRRR